MKRTGFKSRSRPLTAKAPINRTSKKRRTDRYPLRENARGNPCTLRLSKCRHYPEYTVFAHYRKFGWAGTAQKPNDLLGCFACDQCHDMQERHHPEATDTELLRAMGETLMIQLRDGIIKI